MKKFILMLFILLVGFFSVSFAKTETTEVVVTPNWPSYYGEGGGTEPKNEPEVNPETDPSGANGIKRDAEWNIDNDCLRWVWVWCFDATKLLFPGSEIANLNERRTVMTITQDVVYWAMVMVWTVLTIVIIYCGLMFIFAAKWWGDTSRYRKWLVDAAIWALLVWWAYAIVRLIQYIAKW